MMTGRRIANEQMEARMCDLDMLITLQEKAARESAHDGAQIDGGGENGR